MKTIILALLTITIVSPLAQAEAPAPTFESSGPNMLQASPKSLAAAVGHYSRSHALLLAAMREFDQGYSKANPSLVLDADGWRKDVSSRIKELERVLAPQARITEGGVSYTENRSLLASEAGKKK